MKLLIVDGSNICMRASFGGEMPPGQSTPIAEGLIRRAARQAEATHMVVTLDNPNPSWRHTQFPSYKAHRTLDTGPWLDEATVQWTDLGWKVLTAPGYEADDLIATLVQRAGPTRAPVVVSGDSDLFILTAAGVTILRPQKGGVFEHTTEADVIAKYGFESAYQMPDLKAMTGDPGDNIQGVPGIGPVKAGRLLMKYARAADVIQAGKAGACPDSRKVAEHEQTVLTALHLVGLSYDVPLAPLRPSECAIHL